MGAPDSRTIPSQRTADPHADALRSAVPPASSPPRKAKTARQPVGRAPFSIHHVLSSTPRTSKLVSEYCRDSTSHPGLSNRAGQVTHTPPRVWRPSNPVSPSGELPRVAIQDRRVPRARLASCLEEPYKTVESLEPARRTASRNHTRPSNLEGRPTSRPAPSRADDRPRPHPSASRQTTDADDPGGPQAATARLYATGRAWNADSVRTPPARRASSAP